MTKKELNEAIAVATKQAVAEALKTVQGGAKAKAETDTPAKPVQEKSFQQYGFLFSTVTYIGKRDGKRSVYMELDVEPAKSLRFTGESIRMRQAKRIPVTLLKNLVDAVIYEVKNPPKKGGFINFVNSIYQTGKK